jgi:hypothetical protein
VSIDWSSRAKRAVIEEVERSAAQTEYDQLHDLVSLATRYTELSGYPMYVHGVDTSKGVHPMAECSGPLCCNPAVMYRLGEGESRYAVCVECVRKFIWRRDGGLP